VVRTLIPFFAEKGAQRANRSGSQINTLQSASVTAYSSSLDFHIALSGTALQCCDVIESANSKWQWTPERHDIGSHACWLHASSQQAWDPIASSSATFSRKTRTVHTTNCSDGYERNQQLRIVAHCNPNPVSWLYVEEITSQRHSQGHVLLPCLSKRVSVVFIPAMIWCDRRRGGKGWHVSALTHTRARTHARTHTRTRTHARTHARTHIYVEYCEREVFLTNQVLKLGLGVRREYIILTPTRSLVQTFQTSTGSTLQVW
jgi:hypothetical protein